LRKHSEFFVTLHETGNKNQRKPPPPDYILLLGHKRHPGQPHAPVCGLYLKCPSSRVRLEHDRRRSSTPPPGFSTCLKIAIRAEISASQKLLHGILPSARNNRSNQASSCFSKLKLIILFLKTRGGKEQKDIVETFTYSFAAEMERVFGCEWKDSGPGAIVSWRRFRLSRRKALTINDVTVLLNYHNGISIIEAPRPGAGASGNVVSFYIVPLPPRSPRVPVKRRLGWGILSISGSAGRCPFCNRKRELKELQSYAEGKANVVLFSPRRYGKTSLVKRIQTTLSNKGTVTVFADFFGVASVDDVASDWPKRSFVITHKKDPLWKSALRP